MRRLLLVGTLCWLIGTSAQPAVALEVLPPLTGTGGGQSELITAPHVPALQARVVGHYTDPTGRQTLPYNGAYIDDPVSDDYGRRYVVGHDMPRIFQPLHGLVIGDIVYDRWAGYGDGTGRYDHTNVLRVIGVRRSWPSSSGVAPLTAVADTQFKTCEDGRHYYDRIIDLQLIHIT